MNLKIQCNCGAKYAFEVTPESATTPIQFICPNCGVDNSAAFNLVIRQQLASAAGDGATQPKPEEHKPRVRIQFGAQAAAPIATAQPVATARPVATAPAIAIAGPVSAAPAVAATPAAATASSASPPARAGQPVRVAVQRASQGASAVQAEVPPGMAAPQLCLKHAGQIATHQCLVCHKPICPTCMELFGYVCSAFCAGQADKLGLRIPVYENQKSVVEARLWKKVRLVTYGVVALVAGLVAFWSWYAFFGSQPKVAFSVKLSGADYKGYCKLVPPDQALLRHGNRLVRYDVKNQKEIWSTPLIDQKEISEAAAESLAQMKVQAEKWKREMARLKAAGKLDEDYGRWKDEPPKSEAEQLKEMVESIEESQVSKLRWHWSGQDLWVVFPNKLVRYDWQTGQANKEIPVPERVVRFEPSETSLFLVSQQKGGAQILTRISLPGGDAQTEEVASSKSGERANPATSGSLAKLKPAKAGQTELAQTQPQPARAVKGPSANALSGKTPQAKLAQAVAGQTNALAGKARSRLLRDEDDDEEGVGLADLDKSRNELINTGPNAVQLSVKLLEEKLVEYQAMKAKPKTSELEKGVTAANATAAANEILNEWQEERTGGKRTEDESRYRVNIKRLMANGAAEWSGEVTGPPAFYPMKTVDVLVAGKTVQVLDKSNKKLWENKLNYPVSPDSPLERDFWSEEEFSKFSPCAERGTALYLFDQGVLTAFELASGNVRWRLPSVGISKLQFDDKGMMYVTSTSAGADNLKYSQQVDVSKRIVPVIMKVDPQNGKLLWRVQQTGESCRFSGKFFYAIEASRGDGGLLNLGVPEHVRIYRLDPGNGRVLWEHYEKRFPLDLDFHQNSFQLLFQNEMKVVKFISF